MAPDTRSDRGSIPMALLAVIIVTGLVTVVVSSVLTGQRQTRFDQGYEQSLQVSEVGLDRLAHLVRSHQVTEDVEIEDTAAEGGSYEATATLDEDGAWLLSSTGVAADGTSRTTELRLEPSPLFAVAAFGKFFVDFNGGNAADSYRSGEFSGPGGTFVQDPTGSYMCEPDDPPTVRITEVGPGDSDVVMCSPTFNGVVATNGELNLKGNAWDKTDAAEVHYANERIDEEPLPGATGFCSMPDQRCDHDKVSYFRDELVLGPDPVEIPGDLTSQGRFPEDVGSNTLPAGRHLFTDVSLNEDTVIDGDPDEPTIIFMTGKLTIPNHHAVNFETIGGGLAPRPTPSLLIFSNSDGSEAISFGNHAAVSAGIHAPNAGFAGGAQGNVYGSLIAGSINNNGGWNFHWDEALADMEEYAPLLPVRWLER